MGEDRESGTQGSVRRTGEVEDKLYNLYTRIINTGSPKWGTRREEEEQSDIGLGQVGSGSDVCDILPATQQNDQDHDLIMLSHGTRDDRIAANNNTIHCP